MSFKVLIIGAGISGLALAQILRKHSIPFEIFERDDGTRPQGWSLGLDECLAPLAAMLPDDIEPLHNASANYVAGKPDGYAIVHGGTHEVVGLIVPGGGGVDFLNAERNSLRRILMKHVEVQYSKRLKSFVQDEDGVTVHFVDGTSARGSVLVGADGAQSAVRSQMLTGFKADASQYAMISANVKLGEEESRVMLEIANTAILIGLPDMKSYIMLMKLHDDGTSTWHWATAKRYEDADSAHAWAQAASAEELYAEALIRTQVSPPYFRAAVEKTGPQGIHTPPIKLMETVLPVNVLPDGCVTLLGDAAHSMVPFRGWGANTALLDACDLGRVLIKVAEAGEGLRPALREYERTMIPRGREKVLESRAEGEAEKYELDGGRVLQKANGEGHAA
ncbi:hypothetical protein LTS10_004128 [Elasticomyces elasticus]|nr:hypothetical protein LTS10_004128 [Elasticomyces elasticus]